MAHTDDDGQWDSDPLVRALRAPGTPAELTGEADFVAAYRAQQPRGNVRRLVGRFGIGATTAVTTIALSAGVAAAYGRVLPDPVQRIAHSVLGPVGVPAPTAPRTRVPVAAPTTSATAAPGKVPSPTDAATGGTSRLPQVSPTAGPALTDRTPGSTPTPTDAPTPTPTPTSTPTAPVHRVPAALSVAVSGREVAAGSSVTVTGVVTDEDGAPLRGRTVRLMGRSGGAWTNLTTGRTDKTGHVVLTSAPLVQNTVLRLATAHQVRSAVIGIQVLPLMAASATDGAGTSTVTVTVTGGQPGDEVGAYRRKGDALVRIGSARLGADGTARITVPTPKRAVRVVFRLPATKHHGKAQTSLTLGRTTAP